MRIVYVGGGVEADKTVFYRTVAAFHLLNYILRV